LPFFKGEGVKNQRKTVRNKRLRDTTGVNSGADGGDFRVARMPDGRDSGHAGYDGRYRRPVSD
jgi:hypothetical protein